MSVQRWHWEDRSTKSGNARLRFWRLQIGWHVYKAKTPHIGNRWSIQPFIIYDCKPPRSDNTRSNT